MPRINYILIQNMNWAAQKICFNKSHELISYTHTYLLTHKYMNTHIHANYFIQTHQWFNLGHDKVQEINNAIPNPKPMYI